MNETVEEEGILRKICDAYRNLGQAPLYILFTLTVIIPMVYPLGLPIGVTDWTRDYKATLDRVPAGGICLLTVDYCAGGEPTRLPAAVDTIRYLMKKNVKIISLGILMPISTQLQINIFDQIDWAGAGYVYGVDYVLLGYFIGDENFCAAAAEDFPGTVKQDYYTTRVSQLPLIMKIQTSADVDIVAVMTDYGGYVTYWGRQWPSTPTMGLVTATIVGDVLAYYPHIYTGFLDASGAGVAEFEVLASMPGSAKDTGSTNFPGSASQWKRRRRALRNVYR